MRKAFTVACRKRDSAKESYVGLDDIVELHVNAL